MAMKEYKEVIGKMNSVINAYRNISEADPTSLLDFAKDLSTALYYLATVRAGIHDKWQRYSSVLIKEGSSVANAEKLAHIEFPSLYELRNVTKAAYEVLNIIRSHVSLLKQEMQNISSQ